MARLTTMPARVYGLAPRVRSLPKEAEQFYQSRAWRLLVAAIKAERGAWCVKCGAGGRLIGDHIVERKDGGADLDPRNVELLCMKCHARKTAKARAKRARGGR